MLSDDAKMQALCAERDSLRHESAEMQKSVHNTIFAVVTIAGVAAGLYWGTTTEQLAARPTLIFMLIQIQFLLGCMGALLVSNQVIHSAYIQVIEQKMNKLANERLSIWETEVTDAFLFNRSGLSYWIHTIIYFQLALVFVGLIFVAYEFFNNFLFGAILTVELGILLVIYPAARAERRKIQRAIQTTTESSPETQSAPLPSSK